MGHARAVVAGGLLMLLGSLDFEAAVAGEYDVARSVMAFLLVLLLLVAPEAINAWKGKAHEEACECKD